jgi:hypothetical protein
VEERKVTSDKKYSYLLSAGWMAPTKRRRLGWVDGTLVGNEEAISYVSRTEPNKGK